MRMHSFTGQSIDVLYGQLIAFLLTPGVADLVAPRGQPVRELRPVHLRLLDPLMNVVTLPGRRLNYPFMVAEALWVLLARDDVDMLAHYNTRIAQFSDDGRVLHGAYGPRIGAQLPRVIERMRADPDTRQALVQIFDRQDLAIETKDVPCTLFLQFFIREYAAGQPTLHIEKRLELHVAMRSSDAWLGLPYDVFTFTSLQLCVAAELGLKAGEFHLHLGSSHLYDRDRERAEGLLGTTLYHPPACTSRPWPGLPGGAVVEGEHRARTLGTVTADPGSFYYDYLHVLAYRRHRKLEKLLDRGPLSSLVVANYSAGFTP